MKSQNKQELEYTTNKLIYIESELLPQLEELPKYKSNNDIQSLKKNQSDIVSTIEELIRIKAKTDQEIA